jgi:hypothetical protein
MRPLTSRAILQNKNETCINQQLLTVQRLCAGRCVIMMVDGDGKTPLLIDVVLLLYRLMSMTTQPTAHNTGFMIRICCCDDMVDLFAEILHAMMTCSISGYVY